MIKLEFGHPSLKNETLYYDKMSDLNFKIMILIFEFISSVGLIILITFLCREV